MRISDISQWYHGSTEKFEKYDLSTKPVNRASNPHGIYLTKNINLAKEYAGQGGYVYSIDPQVYHTFVYKKTDVRSLVDAYSAVLLKYTNYKQDWIDSVLIPEMLEN